MNPREYELVCNICQARYPAWSEYRLDCCPGGLLKAVYPQQFSLDESATGMWRFRSWLPVMTQGTTDAGSICFPSPELGSVVGLDDLWLSFSGYWPERGGACPTGSFKDLEVAPTLQRLLECGAPGVVVATAGNTGRSFAHFGGVVDYPVVVVVAEQHLPRIWRPGCPQATSTVVIALRDADYGDATEWAGRLADRIGWQVEGGVRNVARRDGIGTLLLDAVAKMGRLPDHYVQAVGGGPGPIGVGDMAGRLIADGHFGAGMPRFHLVQNIEHQPVVRAWRAGHSKLQPSDFPGEAVETFADVLVNRRPAYDMRGGLYDLLTKSRGQAYAVSGSDAADAAALVEQKMGIDVMEPAAVALAGLKQAILTGEIKRDDCVLLAVTGGGIARMQKDFKLYQPDDVEMLAVDDAADRLVRRLEAA